MIITHVLYGRDGRGEWHPIARAYGRGGKTGLEEQAAKYQRAAGKTLARIGAYNKRTKGNRRNAPVTMLRAFRITTSYLENQ